MTKRMLIDSTHAEETRVVVLDGNRLEDYDVETSTKKQLKGNIYLAKIVRVEPSLQAAFVEFGGGRHGFLAFGEIHPDYYQIPVADRKRLLEMQEQEAREEEEAEEREVARSERGRRGGRQQAVSSESEADSGEPQDGGADPVDGHADEPGAADAVIEAGYAAAADPEASAEAFGSDPAEPESPANDAPTTEHEPPGFETTGFETSGFETTGFETTGSHAAEPEAEGGEPAMPEPRQTAQAAAIAQDILIAPEEAQTLFGEGDAETLGELGPLFDEAAAADESEAQAAAADGEDMVETMPAEPPPEDVGGEQDSDERPDRRTTPRFLRNYKIQEVMRRRQILLVQVVKEERGNKGAALTTYISLAGRFSVLMPNSPRGGGISRKITSGADRRRLKEITAELDLPRGMGLIVRTAGANRPKPEIIRDCEYLLNQWDQIRELTMRSMAPALIYEEASLIKRAIRDLYAKDVDDILVDGEEGWRAAHDFMRMLMPTHAKKVQLWRDPQPLFAKAQVEAQLDSMLQPVVQLRSGGYLVINQTEALVAIDVNSGRSTRERGIEETALRTNMEAAEETARQLRLRDLAGLIVIDFIDMESRRNNASVERKMKDALKNDRARIQVGSISHFGLLEMSRQRLRPSLTETSFVACPQCGGTGHVRGTESAALAVLRGIEDEGAKRRSAEIVVHVAGAVAFYILNHKRLRLGEIEERFGLHVSFTADESLRAPDMRIERIRAQTAPEGPAPISQLAPPEPFEDPDEEVPVEEPAALVDAEALPESMQPPEPEDGEADPDAKPGETAEEAEGRRRKRRRRRRGPRREDGAEGPATEQGEPSDLAAAPDGETGIIETGTIETGTIETGSDEIGTAAEPAEPGEAPTGDDETGEDGERKRRGRRGGRRRRRIDAPAGTDEAAPEPEEIPIPIAAAPPPPAYSGPTPANPFGGSNAFDFFDAVELAEQERFNPPAPPPEPPTVDEIEAKAAEATVPHEELAPSLSETSQPTLPDPAPDSSPAPEPVGASEAEPASEAEAGPASGPAVQPVMVDAPAADKKRGWWRR